MRSPDASAIRQGLQVTMEQNRAEKELRIGLVLYGGVSLCIYIYGVVYEFLRLARGEGPYRELAEKTQVKPIIDVISGTSAGGINGLFLAKALATGADLIAIKTSLGQLR